MSAQDEVKRIFSDIENSFSLTSKDLTSPSVISLYQRAMEIYQHSNGCFDITIGPITRLWGFSDKSYHVPSREEITQAMKFVGMEKTDLCEGALILATGMELDWGGIAKGFGVDKAYQAMKAMGIARGYINAGGDLICWGKNPDNQEWKVGIKHPRKNGYLGILSLSGTASATTGDYQRFFEERGVRYHHVFDPRTGYPSQGKQSVTVIGPETIICDALATALFVSKKPQDILYKYPGYGAIIVDSKGKISILGKAYSLSMI